MKIPVTLNGSKTSLEAKPEDSLMDVLRKHSYTSVKCGCNEGHCGACAILLDDNIVASCKIPSGIIWESDIVTLDYFEKTEEYTAISQGFELAGIQLCGYCNSGKYFSAYQILKSKKMLTREEVESQIKNLSPCCTDINTLVNGILLALEISLKGYEETKKRISRSMK